MPVYNAELSIRKAIESCLAQTYANIEIVVLDNGSKDKSSEILKSINDPSLRLLNVNENLGIAAGRNLLLKEAKGEFIAWLDADDEMLQDRIEKQVAHFSKHPELDILGTWIYVEQTQIKKAPLNHTNISAALWFKNCLYQPSMMSRNFYMRENIFYDESFANTLEDYELWYRLRNKKTFGNLDAALTHYKLSSGKDLEDKKAKGNFETNLNRLWSIKWQEILKPIAEKDKLIFQNFLYKNEVLESIETTSILKTLNAIEKQFKDKTYSRICKFHRLRVWRNTNAYGKLKNMHLLLNVIQYPSMSKLNLR
jgi:glycosyltransferase involved in cell wall biosynthesis